MGTGNLQHAIWKLLLLSNDRAQTGAAQVVFPECGCELTKDCILRSNGTPASPTPQRLSVLPQQHLRQLSSTACHDSVQEEPSMAQSAGRASSFEPLK